MRPQRGVRHRGVLSVVMCVVLALLLAVGPAVAANLKNARILFEFNFTDNDLGVQVFLDAAAWRSLTLIGPAGNPILQLDTHGVLGTLRAKDALPPFAQARPGRSWFVQRDRLRS